MGNSMNELPNKAISIIQSGDFTDLSADIIELAFNKDPSVLLKFGLDLRKLAKNISDRRFAKKFCYFILGLKDLKPTERYNVIAELKLKGNEGGEILLALIERLDAITKVEILDIKDVDLINFEEGPYFVVGSLLSTSDFNELVDLKWVRMEDLKYVSKVIKIIK